MQDAMRTNMTDKGQQQQQAYEARSDYFAGHSNGFISVPSSRPLLPPFSDASYSHFMSPTLSEPYSPAMAPSPTFGSNYTYHRDSLSSDMSGPSCPELLYSPTSDPYDSHNSEQRLDLDSGLNFSEYISSPLPTPDEASAEEDVKPTVATLGTPMAIHHRQFRDGPIYSPSLSSSLSGTPSCSSGSEYNFEFDDDAASAGSRSRSPYASSVGPVRSRQQQQFPASPLSARASPYPLAVPHDHLSRRSSSSSVSGALHYNLAALGMASPGMEGSPFPFGSPGVIPHFLDTQSSSAPTSAWDFDTIKRAPPAISDGHLFSPQLHHPQVHQGFYVSPPGFATNLFGGPPETPFNSPSRVMPEAPHSAPARPTRAPKQSRKAVKEEHFASEEDEAMEDDPNDDDYEEDSNSLTGTSLAQSGSGSKRSRQGTVKASQQMYSSLPASMSLPDISTFDKNLLTPQGTLRGMRMPMGGKNPSTTGAFMPLETDESYMHMPTKRSRGRRPLAEADLGLDSSMNDPNAAPTEASLDFVGTTKSGKPKKIFMCKVPDCGKCFKRSEHLKRHVRSIHTDEKPFICPNAGCNKKFSRVDNLNQHLRVHNGGRSSGASSPKPRKPRRTKQEPAEDSDDYQP